MSATENTDLDHVISVAASYQGMDIQFRRVGMGADTWPAPWRVTLYSCKHKDVRRTVYGDTLGAALDKALEKS